MLRWLVKSVLQYLLILIELVVVSFILPVASFWLVRDLIGAQGRILGFAVGVSHFGAWSPTSS